jgi:hypothetical protein
MLPPPPADDPLLDELAIEDCSLGSEEWRGVCEATADQPRVDSVTLIERFGNVVVGRDTLLPLLRRTSGVVTLVVHASSWSDDDGAFEEFVKGRRTNERLRELTLYCFGRREHPDLRLMEELLNAYNWTMETVTVRSFSDIATRHRVLLLLVQNRRVRAALGNRDDDDDDNEEGVQPPPRLSHEAPLWPLVLAMYSRFPTLLYRFLRKHNLEALIDEARRAAAISREKRSHIEVSATLMKKRRRH